MHKAIVKKIFDDASKDYDRIKVQIIPKYREVEKLIQDYVTLSGNRRVKILELGTGTGKWAFKILKKYPKAHYCGIDFSERMLEVASRKLINLNDRCTLHNLDLNEERPKGKYDLIYSAFTFHHVKDKKRLFKILFSLLEHDGRLLYVDVTIAKNRDLEALFLKRWREFMLNSSWPNNKIQTIINDHLEYDIPETVEDQLRSLSDAGFKSCDVIWRYDKFAAFWAAK